MTPTLLFLLFMIPGTFFLGAYDVLLKKVLKSGVSEGILLGLVLTVSGVALFLVTLIVGPPEIKEAFWPAFTGTVILNIFSQLAWFKAFRREDASLISPLRLLTPPLVILTGFLVLKETINLWGVIGIFTTVAGLWFLLASQAKFDQVSLISMFKRPGVLYGLAGAFLFAFSFPLDKKAVINSSGLFFAGAAFFIIGLVNFLWAYSKRENRASLSLLRTEKGAMLAAILMQALGGWLTLHALNFSLAAYASSVKRLWSFWSVLLSGAFLKEGNIAKKLLATIIMLTGLAITVFLG